MCSSDLEDRTDDSAEETSDSTNEKAVEEALTDSRNPDDPAPSDAELKAAKKTITSQEKTRLQAEVTPEARKVRRAKAQAAYAAASFGGTAPAAVDITIS